MGTVPELSQVLAWHGFMHDPPLAGELPRLVIAQWVDDYGQCWWTIFRWIDGIVECGTFEMPEYAMWEARNEHHIVLLQPCRMCEAAFPWLDDEVFFPSVQVGEVGVFVRRKRGSDSQALRMAERHRQRFEPVL